MELTIIETSAYLELKKTAQHTVCENGFPGYYISSVRGVGYKFNKYLPERLFVSEKSQQPLCLLKFHSKFVLDRAILPK